MMKTIALCLFLIASGVSEQNFVFNNVKVQLISPGIIADGEDIKKTESKEIVIKQDNKIESYVKAQKDLEVEFVKIVDQNIPELREDSIANLQDVTLIEIISSGVKVIYSGAFKNLPKLQTLKIIGNHLEEIKAGVFNNFLQNDFTLDLGHNLISKIDDGAFTNMHLHSINLQHNKLTIWGSSWFDNSVVRYLGFAENGLEEIPDNAFNFLKTQISHAAELDFSRNKIKTIHPIKGVTKINYLDLTNNHLEELLAGTFESSEIGRLHLDNNKLKTVNLEAFKSTKINFLHLENNRLKCIPTEIVDTIKVEVIEILGNPITDACKATWAAWKKQRNKAEYEVINFKVKQLPPHEPAYRQK